MYDFVNVMNVCDRMSERMHVACISNDLSLCELVRMYECVYTADVTHFIATPGCLHDITRHAIATHWACHVGFTENLNMKEKQEPWSKEKQEPWS